METAKKLEKNTQNIAKKFLHFTEVKKKNAIKYNGNRFCKVIDVHEPQEAPSSIAHFPELRCLELHSRCEYPYVEYNTAHVSAEEPVFWSQCPSRAGENTAEL